MAEADKTADKSKDSWQAVAEYESDELASGSEDEKRLKKARKAAGCKTCQKELSPVIVERNRELLWALMVSFFW